VNILEETRMRIVFHLCLLAACGAMGSELALAASHGHRPATAAARSAPAGEDTGKSTVTPTGSADTMPPPSAPGGNAGDAPIDTSITVNQGHRVLTGKEAAAKRLTTELGKLIPGKAKPHPPVHPFVVHAVPHRNAIGAVAAHSASPTANHAAATTAPVKPGAQPGAIATAPATPGLRDGSGTAAPGPKSPAAISAENNGHGAAVLKTIIANGPSINGTGIAKSFTATAAVGGPAKTVAAAAVGGSSFRPRHP
jgi:hypothetical protein